MRKIWNFTYRNKSFLWEKKDGTLHLKNKGIVQRQVGALPLRNRALCKYMTEEHWNEHKGHRTRLYGDRYGDQCAKRVVQAFHQFPTKNFYWELGNFSENGSILPPSFQLFPFMFLFPNYTQKRVPKLTTFSNITTSSIKIYSSRANCCGSLCFKGSLQASRIFHCDACRKRITRFRCYHILLRDLPPLNQFL